MRLEAYWDLPSILHIAKHGVTPAEVDYVRTCNRHFPRPSETESILSMDKLKRGGGCK
jgi:hypothetical protein